MSVFKPFAFLLLFVSLAKTNFSQNTFTVTQIKEDLSYYKKKLEKHHPNLYLYSSPQTIDRFFDSLSNTVTAPLTHEEFYQKITQTSHLIKDGHTLILPGSAYIENHNQNSKFLPLQIGLYENRLFVRRNSTKVPMIEDGQLLDSINGVSSQEIITLLLRSQVRDGIHPSYSNWILDRFFREYYSYYFGHPESYQISFQKNGIRSNVKLQALLKDSIYQYQDLNYPKPSPSISDLKGIYLDFDSLHPIPILTIADFHTSVLKNVYHQSFEKEIQKIFDTLLLQQPEHLIIDLRNNQGGDVENGVLLLSYLLSKPFKVVNEYYRMKKGQLKKCGGPSQGIHSPQKEVFNGKVYVLINGGSFSNSVIVSSCLKENARATFIGTETGGNPHVLAGNAKTFMLPHSKLMVDIPTKRFVMTSLEKNTGTGLLPDYELPKNSKYDPSSSDTLLPFTLHLIQKK